MAKLNLTSGVKAEEGVTTVTLSSGEVTSGFQYFSQAFDRTPEFKFVSPQGATGTYTATSEGTYKFKLDIASETVFSNAVIDVQWLAIGQL